jgi:GntR family transcriptional regulator/MocR family aminotransferase
MTVDESGAAPSPTAFLNTRLLYVTPGHQFPTGVTMPVSRRTEILGHAGMTGTFIFEDDYDSEYRYSGNPLPSMQGIDKHGLVIFAGSFNKLLFPSLRMGYIVVPPTLIEHFAMSKALQSRHHSVLDQAVVCDFINEGHFSSHLRRMRKIYAERLQILTSEMSRNLAGAVELSTIEAGLQTVGWLSSHLTADRIAALALEQNVDVVPLTRYSRLSPTRDGIQIGFAAVDEQAIVKGVQVLARIMSSR